MAAIARRTLWFEEMQWALVSAGNEFFAELVELFGVGTDGAVVQLGRTPVLQAGGHGFESRPLHHLFIFSPLSHFSDLGKETRKAQLRYWRLATFTHLSQFANLNGVRQVAIESKLAIANTHQYGWKLLKNFHGGAGQNPSDKNFRTWFGSRKRSMIASPPGSTSPNVKCG